MNRPRIRIFPLKSNQPGCRESEGQANGELNKVRDVFQHLSALVHWSMISLGEIKRWYQELTLHCLLITASSPQHTTEFFLWTDDSRGGCLVAQLADKAGISGFSNQNTPEYLRKAKPAKYLRSRHKYLLLRVRSYPQIIANYRRAPTLRPRRGTAPAAGPAPGAERLRRLCPRQLGLCRLHHALPAPNPHFCALLPI